MIKSLNTVIGQHLKGLDLSPTLIENLTEHASLWSFQLTPDIETELFCQISNKNDITLTLIVSMDTDIQNEIQNAFTMAIAQVSAPVTITSVKEAITIRLTIKTHLQSLNPLLAEAVVVIRHFVGPIFLGAFELQTGKNTLPEAVEGTLKKLQHLGQTA